MPERQLCLSEAYPREDSMLEEKLQVGLQGLEATSKKGLLSNIKKENNSLIKELFIKSID